MAELSRKGLRWKRIEQLARVNAVLGAVYRSLVDERLESLVDAPVLERMSEFYEHNTAQNTLLLHETAEVLARLEGRGIEPLVLKGAALLVAHFPCLGSRHLDDADVFIPADQVEETLAVLDELGYRRKLGCDGAPLPIDLSDPHDAFLHHLPAHFSPRGSPLELHIASPSSSDAAVWEAIRARSRSCRWQGVDFRVPAPEDLVWMASYHTLSKHHDDGRFVPRLLLDLHVLSATTGVRPEDVTAPVETGDSLPTASAYLRAMEGSGDSSRAEGLFLAAATPGDLAEHAGRLGRLLRLDPRVLMRTLFPSREYMTFRYGKPPNTMSYLKRLARGMLPPTLRGR